MIYRYIFIGIVLLFFLMLCMGFYIHIRGQVESVCTDMHTERIGKYKKRRSRIRKLFLPPLYLASWVIGVLRLI